MNIIFLTNNLFYDFNGPYTIVCVIRIRVVMVDGEYCPSGGQLGANKAKAL